MMRPTPGSSPLRGRQGRRAVGLVGLVGAWCLALQGCASLAGTQHPFKNAPAPEITEIVASPSVMVAPVGGPPPQVGRVLAELVADALRQRDVLAVTRDPAPGSMLLAGHAEMVPEAKDHALLRVTWSLIQPDGLTTGTFQSEQTIPVLPGKDPYQRLSASAMVPFANRAAFRTADLIQNRPKPVQVASNADDVAVPGAADADADAPDQGADAGPARPSKAAENDKAVPKAEPEAAAKAARKPDKAAKADIAEKPQPKDSAAKKAEARPAPKPAERTKPETVARTTSIMADIRADEADLVPSSFSKEAADRTATYPAPEPAVAKAAKAEQSPAAAAKPAMAEPPPAKATTSKAPPTKMAAARPAEPPKPAVAAAPAESVPAGPAKAAPAPQAVTDLQQASLAAAMSRGEKKKAAREVRAAQKEPGHAEKAGSASGTGSAGGVRVASAVATTAAGAGLIGTAEALKASASSPAAAPQQSTPPEPAAQQKPAKPEPVAATAEPKPTRPAETAPPTAEAPKPEAMTATAPKPNPAPEPTPKPASATRPEPAADAQATPPPAAPETQASRTAAQPSPTRPSAPAPASPPPAASAPPPAPRQIASLPAAPAAPREPITDLIVAPVQGAPGNGNQMLATAIKQALRGAGLQVGDYSRGPQTAVLHGRVSVADAGGDAEDVNIEWAVYDSAGRFLGTVTQHNRLPRSLVEGRWDETAGMAAAGAVTGIRRLITQPTAGGAS